MTTMVSLLRGVNVAGRNLVKMSELAELCRSLGFVEVRTHLQSGNVVFSYSGKDTSEVGARMEQALKQRMDLDVAVFVRTGEELQCIISKNPFRAKNRSRLHVTFLRTRPANIPMDKLNALRDRYEEFAIKDREVYLFLPNGIGRSKLSNNFLERMLGIKATTRNWNTVTALSDLATQNPK